MMSKLLWQGTKNLFLKSKCHFSISFGSYENATIVDHRVSKDENPYFLLTCEHALNMLPSNYKWDKSDLTHFANAHWAYDIGALKLAQHLSKKLKCLLVHSNYSRLLCDVNRPITSETLFRKYGDANEVMLNKNMSQKEERHRLEKFYHTYYYAFREISLKTNPKIIISLHSYNPVYEGSKREVEVGVLTSFCDDLGLNFKNGFDAKEYKCELNKPWSGKEGFCFGIDHLILAKHPIERSGLVIEFRNDLLSDPTSFGKILGDMEEIINKLKVADN